MAVPPISLRLPPAILAVAACLTAMLGVVVYDQSHWWVAKEDYTFGWLVPLFVIYVVYDRWPALSGLARGPGADEAAAVPLSLQFLAWSVFAGGTVFFVLGGVYRAAAGPSFNGTLVLTLGASCLVLSSVFLASDSLVSAQWFSLCHG